MEQMTDNRQPILELRHISKTFRTDDGREVRAVRDANLAVYPGESVALVGESGCGKSTVARMVTRLISPTEGEIILCGRDISKLEGKGLRDLYRDIQMVFQDPYSVFSPRMSVGTFLGEGLVHHGIMNRAKATEEAKKLLAGLRAAEKQVLALLMRLRKELELTFVFIGHDLAVVRAIADRIAVMYAGMIVEELGSEDLTKARHPYTQRLLESVFSVHDRTNQKVIRVEDMSMAVNANSLPGCPFRPRCPRAMDECGTACPALRELEPGHRAACPAV